MINMMSKVHPSEGKVEGAGGATTSGRAATLWTVWKKSSMAFQGTDGFSVYDNEGRLAYRVDNYSRRSKLLSGEVLLMDGAGGALLSLKPQIMSLHDRWNGFKAKDGSKAGSKSQVFTMRRRSIVQQGDRAEVFMGKSLTPAYQIEGCYSKRCCKIRDSTGEVIAEMSRKKANNSLVLSDDVFSLLIQPGADCQLLMAFIVVMDRICKKPLTLTCY